LHIDIIGAESLGVRGLCCLVTTGNRRILIDPGVALGYRRRGLLPHPLQIGVGRGVRTRIIHALGVATDVVFSHFHGDHVPLADANPYQLSLRDILHRAGSQRCWSKSGDGLSEGKRQCRADLLARFGDSVPAAEGFRDGILTFSGAVPHGAPKSSLGTVMMTRIETGVHVFVHASDIQLLDDTTTDAIIDWGPTTVLAAGPPLYLGRLSPGETDRAWKNAVRLVEAVGIVILDHHLMRDAQGVVWLNRLSDLTGKRVYCAADFMGRPRRLLEAHRQQLYEEYPVPVGWHERYAHGEVSVRGYFEGRRKRAETGAADAIGSGSRRV